MRPHGSIDEAGAELWFARTSLETFSSKDEPSIVPHTSAIMYRCLVFP